MSAEAYQVPCPLCGAHVGERCRSRFMPQLFNNWPHAAREAEARGVCTPIDLVAGGAGEPLSAPPGRRLAAAAAPVPVVPIENCDVCPFLRSDRGEERADWSGGDWCTAPNGPDRRIEIEELASRPADCPLPMLCTTPRALPAAAAEPDRALAQANEALLSELAQARRDCAAAKVRAGRWELRARRLGAAVDAANEQAARALAGALEDEHGRIFGELAVLAFAYLSEIDPSLASDALSHALEQARAAGVPERRIAAALATGAPKE